jgi:hypothetical protein
VSPSVVSALGWKFNKLQGVVQGSDLLRPVGRLFAISKTLGEFRGQLRIDGKRIEGMTVSVVNAFSDREPGAKAFSELTPWQCHTAWLPLLLAEKFLRSPSALTLADVIDEVADRAWDTRDSWPLYALPWPLANCLDAVKDVEKLREVSRRLRQGAFGDAPDWEASERRWTSEGIDIEAIRDLPPDDISLDDRGHLGLRHFAKSIAHQEYSASVCRTLLRVAQHARSQRVREHAFWFWAIAGGAESGLDEIEPGEFRNVCSPLGSRLWAYVNTGAGPLTAAWLEVFDSVGRSHPLDLQVELQARHAVNVSKWCKSFQAAFVDRHTKHSSFGLGLLRLLGRMASVGITVDSIPADMLNIDASADPCYAGPCYCLASILVRLTNPSLTADAAAYLSDQAEAVLKDPLAEPQTSDLIFATAGSHLDRVPAILQFVLRLREKMPPSVEFGVAQCDRLLRRALRGRVSELHPEDRLRKMQLPIVPLA